MKILFDHPSPFALAHGGFQIQIEQTKAALERHGIEVEFVRWWDAGQTGEIIHHFGRPTADYIRLAQARSMKVVLAELLTGLGSRPAPARLVQKGLINAARTLLPATFTSRLAWDAYRLADACVAVTAWEARLMHEMFDAPSSKITVIPNGVEAVFFSLADVPREKATADYLVCTAAITPRKRILELAEAAALARVPVWIIGRPYSEPDAYHASFLELQRQNPDCLRYEGEVADRVRLAQIYREARGFVLLSDKESLSLSALEAAAAQCPLLLSDLPWARTVFGANATYVPISIGREELARTLRRFHDNASSLRPQFKPLTWDEVAEKLHSLYLRLIGKASI